MDGSWLQLKLKRRRLQRRLHAHLTLLHVYYPWNQIKSILLLNIRITKQTNPNLNLLTLILMQLVAEFMERVPAVPLPVRRASRL